MQLSQKPVMIVVEEKLNYVIYADGPEGKPRIIDRLTIELKACHFEFPEWDYELEAAEASVKIHVDNCERPFLVEGVENLYYVSENQVHCARKEEMFEDAVDKSIANEFIENAGLNGYDISDPSCKRRVKKAAAMVLKHVDSSEQTVRIPYPLPPDYSKVCPGLDASQTPDIYTLDKDDCERIEQALLAVVKDRLGIGQSLESLPLYSYNWFISQLRISE